MIDTVRLKIYNLDQNKELRDHILSYKLDGKGVSNDFQEVDLEEEYQYMKLKYYNDVTLFHDTNKRIQKNYAVKIPSWTYDITTFIDWSKDCAIIEFSVPKYLYATNIFMFTPTVHDNPKNFITNDLKDRLYHSYDDLRHFFDYFFNKVFANIRIPVDTIYIDRIDYCFNQVCTSKKDALDYISQQSLVHKKRLRATSSGYKLYMGGIHYVTKAWTFKIYHKGMEFKAHDYPVLRKRKIENLSDLQDFADKIVRYELSIRNAGITYIYKHHIVKKKSEKNTTLHRASIIYKNDGKEIFKQRYQKKFHTVQNFNKFYEAVVKYYEWLQKSQEFLLYPIPDTVYFDRRIHNKICDYFIENIENYRVVYQSDLSVNIAHIAQKLKETQKERKKMIALGHLKASKSGGYGISPEKIKMITALLAVRTIKQIKESKLVSPKTIRCYEKFLKEKGIVGYILNERYIHVLNDLENYFLEINLKYALFVTRKSYSFYQY